MKLTCREVIDNGEKVLKCVTDPLTRNELVDGICFTICIILVLILFASMVYGMMK